MSGRRFGEGQATRFQMVPLPEFVARYGECRIRLRQGMAVWAGVVFLVLAFVIGAGFWLGWDDGTDPRAWMLFGPPAPAWILFLVPCGMHFLLRARHAFVSITAEGVSFAPSGATIAATDIALISLPQVDARGNGFIRLDRRPETTPFLVKAWDRILSIPIGFHAVHAPRPRAGAAARAFGPPRPVAADRRPDGRAPRSFCRTALTRCSAGRVPPTGSRRRPLPEL